MPCCSQTAVSPPTGNYFFEASQVSAQVVAKSISEFYRVSIILSPELATKEVSGALASTNLVDSLQAFAFMLGAPYRASDSKAAYFFGGKAPEFVTSVSSYGFTESAINTALGGKAHVVGDSVVISADVNKVSEIREALRSIGNRPSINLELIVVDTTGKSIDRLNDWLDSMTAVTELAARNIGGVKAAGFFYNFDISSLLKLVDTDAHTKIDLHEKVSIMSGSQTLFTSGEVVEDVTIVREPHTGNDLVSRIDRRTVGLTLTIGATHFDGQWHLTMSIEDSAIAQGKEQTTRVNAEKIVKPDGSILLLASFNRAGDEETKKAVPIFSAIPKIGQWFRKSERTRTNRQFTVFVRPTI